MPPPLYKWSHCIPLAPNGAEFSHDTLEMPPPRDEWTPQALGSLGGGSLKAGEGVIKLEWTRQPKKTSIKSVVYIDDTFRRWLVRWGIDKKRWAAHWTANGRLGRRWKKKPANTGNIILSKCQAKNSFWGRVWIHSKHETLSQFSTGDLNFLIVKWHSIELLAMNHPLLRGENICGVIFIVKILSKRERKCASDD